MPEVKLQFSKEKETPGTVRFQENGDREKHVVGTLYVKKASEFSKQETLDVTIKAGK